MNPVVAVRAGEVAPGVGGKRETCWRGVSAAGAEEEGEVRDNGVA